MSGNVLNNVFLEWFIGAGLFVYAVPQKPLIALEPPPLTVQLELQELAEQTQADEPEKPRWTSCITYLRQKWGIPIYGDALFQSPDTTLSEVQYGDVTIFLYGMGVDKSHVAMFDHFDKTGFWVWEYNRKPGLEEHRLVSYADPYLLGFKSFK